MGKLSYSLISIGKVVLSHSDNLRSHCEVLSNLKKTQVGDCVEIEVSFASEADLSLRGEQVALRDKQSLTINNCLLNLSISLSKVVSTCFGELIESLIEVLRDRVNMAIQAVIRDTRCLHVHIDVIDTKLLECLEDHSVLVGKHALQVGLSESDPPLALAVHSNYDLTVLIY